MYIVVDATVPLGTKGVSELIAFSVKIFVSFSVFASGSSSGSGILSGSGCGLGPGPSRWEEALLMGQTHPTADYLWLAGGPFGLLFDFRFPLNFHTLHSRKSRSWRPSVPKRSQDPEVISDGQEIE